MKVKFILFALLISSIVCVVAYAPQEHEDMAGAVDDVVIYHYAYNNVSGIYDYEYQKTHQAQDEASHSSGGGGQEVVIQYTPTCGDMNCENGEDLNNCPSDCSLVMNQMLNWFKNPTPLFIAGALFITIMMIRMIFGRRSQTRDDVEEEEKGGTKTYKKVDNRSLGDKLKNGV
jgi:hypothetical protein